MNEWPEVRFGNICENSAFGPRFSSDNYAPDGNVATLRTTDMRADGRIESSTMPLAKLNLKALHKHILRRGDLVITRTGRVGTTAVFEEHHLPVLPGAFLIRFRLNRTIADPLFYQYFFNSPEGQNRLLATATGSVQQNLNITALHGVMIPLPPLAVQKQLASVLRSLDVKIEQNRRTSAALERLARAIFKAWFVDFEPVKAKDAGATNFPSMPQEIFNALPTRFVASELGPVPEGWAKGKLGDIAAERRESVDPSDVEPTTPYIGLEHMPRRCISLMEWEHAGKVTSGKARFRAGQILFGKLRPYFHKVGIAPLDGVCSTDIVVVEPKSLEWFGLTLGHLSSDDFVAHTNACSTGTKMPRTNWRDMAGYTIAIPPEPVAKAFSDLISPMTSLLIRSIFESRKLAELRDYLLPRLLTGRVRVKEAEQAGARSSMKIF